MDHNDAPVRPPKQGRSKETLARILDAAEALLADRNFDELRIEDVVKKAKTSVGVFYSRFRDKNALLDTLYERNQQTAIKRFEKLDASYWRDASVEEIVRDRVRAAVKSHREHRGIYRALVLRGYLKPDWRYRDPVERDKLAVGRFGTLIEAHRDEIAHEDARQAGAMAALLIMSVLRETILFGDSTASAVNLDDARLEAEIIRLVLAYLGVEPSGETKS